MQDFFLLKKVFKKMVEVREIKGLQKTDNNYRVEVAFS